MSETSVTRFYDEMADGYHLIYSDWDASMRRHGNALDALIGDDRVEVLDCSCGIGTQAIGLAMRGYRVTGTDLSPAPPLVPVGRRSAGNSGCGLQPPVCGNFLLVTADSMLLSALTTLFPTC